MANRSSTDNPAPAPAVGPLGPGHRDGSGQALDDDARYRALRARDARFDGRFFVGVRTTGIYCRPSCPTPVHPLRRNVEFHPSAAAAQRAGFRACKRCRPDATPGSPDWNVRSDLAGRALRLIAEGVVDRDGVHGLAARLSVSTRHLNRVLNETVGAGPVALARAQRAQTSRLLIETTGLPFAEVAFAAGFSSIRQFNDTVREVYACTPGALRSTSTSRRSERPAEPSENPPGQIRIRLAVRAPFDHAHLWQFLTARAIAGVESVRGATYARSVRLPHGPAVVELVPFEDHVAATFHLGDLRDLAVAVARTRRLCDLDADPVEIDAALAADDALAHLVRRGPGRRSPGALDPVELAVRTVLGQQVSVAAARTTAERLAARLGEELPHPVAGIDRLFPEADALAEVDPASLGVPAARGRAVVTLAGALADGSVALDGGVDRAAATESLLAITGIGPWTASYVAMRALSDPDVILPTDLAVRAGARRVGLDDAPAALGRHAARWAPWRSYATHHLWSADLPASGWNGSEVEPAGGTQPTDRSPA